MDKTVADQFVARTSEAAAAVQAKFQGVWPKVVASIHPRETRQ